MTSFLYFYRILKKHVHIDKESKMIHRKNSSASNLQQSRIGFSCPPFLMLIVHWKINDFVECERKIAVSTFTD